MPSFYLNSYAPLVASKAGRDASISLKIPPFVDGSIRREPDFEHARPAISSLCRGGKFVPRLCVGDVIAYITKKGRFGLSTPQRRLTAVLQVDHLFANHNEAAAWYEHHQLPLPSNCMTLGNPPIPLEQTHQKHSKRVLLNDVKLHRLWDNQYRARAKQYGIFAVCQIIFRDLSWNAPYVDDQHLLTAFAKIPATLNPGALNPIQFQAFLNLLGIDAPLSAR